MVYALFRVLKVRIKTIASQNIIFQNLVGPLTEINTSFGIHSIAYADDHIKIIDWNFSANNAPSLLLNLSEFPTG